MALLSYSLEQVDEQLMRFGEDHAELRAEVRSAAASSVSVARAAKRETWQGRMERLCLGHHGGERPLHGGEAEARGLLEGRLERQVCGRTITHMFTCK